MKNTEIRKIIVGDIPITIIFKDIKNIHLNVFPPAGEVRVSSPRHIDEEAIRVFVIAKLSWIKTQQKRFQNQIREPIREYISRESHYYLGRQFLLKIKEAKQKPDVEIQGEFMVVNVRDRENNLKIQEAIEQFYRNNLREIASNVINKYESELQVQVTKVTLKKMKTKWGTCNPDKGTILLNLELIKKPVELIEYIVIHEMIHLIERTHNKKFIAYIDKYVPNWRSHREELNKLPLETIAVER